MNFRLLDLLLTYDEAFFRRSFKSYAQYLLRMRSAFDSLALLVVHFLYDFFVIRSERTEYLDRISDAEFISLLYRRKAGLTVCFASRSSSVKKRSSGR